MNAKRCPLCKHTDHDKAGCKRPGCNCALLDWTLTAKG